ncbi:MAG: Methyltransferase type 11 [Fibrobacteres bacterium]|nr:Methyltransferase type 11 [Fibrobacterota bacterium]
MVTATVSNRQANAGAEKSAVNRTREGSGSHRMPAPPGNGKTGIPKPMGTGRFQGPAESGLEGSFLPDPEILASFLINALYLFGDQAIAAYGGVPEGVTDRLTRLGHGVSEGAYSGAGRNDGGRGGRSGAMGPRGAGIPLPRPLRGTGRDRALFLARAFGRGGDADILAGLKAMRATVRPGGLICFHVFDRDRAWSLVGERAQAWNGTLAQVRVGFEPGTGRLTARPSEPFAPGLRAEGGCGAYSIKAWNLAEIQALLRSAGLDLERAYGDWDGRSPEAAGGETARLILVAARPRRARRATRDRS